MSRFDPLSRPEPPAIRGYGIAVLSVATAMIIVRWPPLHLQQGPASLFLCAILLSAWFGGARPGVLATVSSVFAYYYFLPPINSLGAKPAELPRLFVVATTALFVWWLSTAQKRTTESLRRARDDLKVRVQEIQQTNEALRAESCERMQVENRLRHSEAYLAEAQRLSHTGSFGWKPSTGEIFWSEESFRIFRYDRSTKPTVELVLQRVHPEDAPSFKVTVEQASRGGKDFAHEYRLVMPDSSIKHVHVVAHAERDASGEVEFVGALMEITSAKEAEDRTRLIIDTVPAQLWTESPEGIVDFVNHRWIDYTGMTLAQAVGSGWNRMVHPDDIARVLSKWRILISEGKPREIESRLRRSDGTYRWFLSRCCPLVDRSGHILGWYGSDTDIHDRKEAEETLRRSEGYLAEAQRLSHTGSWAWAPATDDITYLSEECHRVLGFDRREGLPRIETFFQRIHPND